MNQKILPREKKLVVFCKEINMYISSFQVVWVLCGCCMGQGFEFCTSLDFSCLSVCNLSSYLLNGCVFFTFYFMRQVISYFNFRITNLYKTSLPSWVWMNCLKMTNWQLHVHERSKDSFHSLSKLLRCLQVMMANLFPWR